MTDYSELVKALRCDNTGDDECGSSDCPYWSGLGCMDGQLMEDAADAIEDLEGFLAEAERDRDEYEDRMRKEQERVIELQADVKRLKDSNEELREKQTYIDHYGAEWMTSAKDVPTAAYEHGYADGRDEAEAQLPKRGKWIEDATTYAGPGLSNYKCSLCGKICGTWRRGLEPSELPNWCGNCGADMRAKMEVQDG